MQISVKGNGAAIVYELNGSQAAKDLSIQSVLSKILCWMIFA